MRTEAVIAIGTVLLGASFGGGILHQKIDDHTEVGTHPKLAERVQSNEVTLARVSAVLELLEKRK